MQLIIRKGTLEDLEAARNLVIELAIYEKEPEAVTATIEDYQNGFSDGDFDFHVAEKAGQIVGLALYYMTFSTWKGKMLYLEDFIVTENLRNNGIGQLLWEAVIQEAKNRNCVLLKWQVLDWNQPALDFYQKNEAIIEREWWNGKIILQNEKYPELNS